MGARLSLLSRGRSPALTQCELRGCAVQPPFAMTLTVSKTWRRTEESVSRNNGKKKALRLFLLAIEVLSVSTARRDRGVKRRIYLDEQVDEYWIVDADAWCIERWRRGDDRPEIVIDTLAWRSSGSVEALLLDVPRLLEDALR
ncbi:MAG: Uma2 family endonuclease [Gemmatimonadetes bacterium]|nr:Uma2 family endonuclease [Gemmatimonadota bacterium]